MPKPATVLDKAQVLSALYASWEAVHQLTADLSEEQWQTPTCLPGWSVHDVVAHVIGVEAMLCGMAPPEADIDVSSLEHVRNEIGVMNECWVRHLRGERPAELLDRLRSVTDDRRKVLADMADADWNTVGFTPAGPDTHGRFMRIRTFDTWMHEHDIREAIGASASEEELRGPAGELALDEMVASMGFVVGKLGGAPEGSRVALELTGPLARTIRVAVDGRAAVVEEFDGDPTTTITLDGLLFTRIAGGRTAFDSHVDAVEFGGDAEVGTRIVKRLAYTV